MLNKGDFLVSWGPTGPEKPPPSIRLPDWYGLILEKYVLQGLTVQPIPKPPNISWGLDFPLAWAAMFSIRSGSGLEESIEVLSSVMAISVLFGTTSMLAVTATFEKENMSTKTLAIADGITHEIHYIATIAKQNLSVT